MANHTGDFPFGAYLLLSLALRDAVNDPGLGKRKVLTQGLCILLPGYVARVAASAPPVLPRSLGVLEEDFAPLHIATSTILLVIAAPFCTSRPLRLLPWRMAVCTTPCPSLFPTPAPTFPDRLARDDPVSPAWLGPGVGKSENGACPLAVRRCLSPWRLFALDQHRLFGMHGQPATIAPFRQDLHDPAGVCFPLETDDAILGHTRQEAPALPPGLPVLDTPFVHHLMQPYVGS